jgi:TonB family protein
MGAMQSKRVLLACAFASIAVHLALLIQSNYWSVSDARGLGLAPGPQQLNVRLVFKESALDPPPPEGTESAATLPSALDSGLVAERRDDAKSPVTNSDAAAANANTSSLLPAGSAHSRLEYVPSEFLTFVPKPLSPLEIPFPDTVTGDVHVHVLLSVYIDESGRVTQVNVDSSPQLEPLQDAAVNTFLTTRFKPGELDGQIVRSIIHVEVSFESSGASGRLRRPTVNM